MLVDDVTSRMDDTLLTHITDLHLQAALLTLHDTKVATAEREVKRLYWNQEIRGKIDMTTGWAHWQQRECWNTDKSGQPWGWAEIRGASARVLRILSPVATTSKRTYGGIRYELIKTRCTVTLRIARAITEIRYTGIDQFYGFGHLVNCHPKEQQKKTIPPLPCKCPSPLSRSSHDKHSGGLPDSILPPFMARAPSTGTFCCYSLTSWNSARGVAASAFCILESKHLFKGYFFCHHKKQAVMHFYLKEYLKYNSFDISPQICLPFPFSPTMFPIL